MEPGSTLPREDDGSKAGRGKVHGRVPPAGLPRKPLQTGITIWRPAPQGHVEQRRSKRVCFSSDTISPWPSGAPPGLRFNQRNEVQCSSLCRRCRLYLSLNAVDHNCLFPTLRCRSVDRTQVDAPSCEFLQTLRQRTGLVGQFVLLRRSLLVGEASFVQSLLCPLGVFDDELN